MRVTNNAGLPQALVDAVANDDYIPGDSDISVTALIAPPQQRAILDAHQGEIVEDASDRLWALQGQLIHSLLERANENDLAETRYYVESDGWKVGGRFDHLTTKDAVLTDWKYTSVWSIIFGGVKPEWTEQLNLLDLILRQNGHIVDRLQVIAIMRDWSKLEARRKPDEYPQQQVVTLPVERWSELEQEEFLSRRVQLHQDARLRFDHGDPQVPCTPEERWSKPDKWAVMKEGRKSAIRVLDSREAAISYCLDNNLAGRPDDMNGNPLDHDRSAIMNRGIHIIHRPGEDVRCMSYCAASEFCEQFKANQAAMASSEDE
jgi:hypothetical protein